MNRSLVASAFIWTLLTAGLSTRGDAASSAMRLVGDGKPAAVIVLGPEATWIERRAAEELTRYVRAMSGASLPVVTTGRQPLSARAMIVIGRARSNPFVARLVRKGTVKLSPDYPGADGFVIKTALDAGGSSPTPCLVLGGSSDRATLYAVYHFLERFCGVGFFWDGDYVPRRRTLDVPSCDLVERPRFPIRQYLQGCAFGYSTAYWNWADWRKELDWMAKRYQNTMMADWRYPHWRRVRDYARRLGIRIILPGGGLGRVRDEFRKQHPEVRYVKMQWGQETPYYVIHPSDPMFVQRGVETIRHAIRTYGADHLYNVDPYAEQTVFLPPEEIARMRADFARAVAHYIRTADPKGVWYASGWALRAPPWPKETVKAFLEAIPRDMFYVCDIWADEHPIYKKFDYFSGHQWGFGVLHSFGGDDTLRGDLAGLIRRVQEVVQDPRADRCVAFYINPEIIHYNNLYFELAAKLSWDPMNVSLDDYLRDYALRRYGAESAPTMLECLRRLARSVYSSSSRATEPCYQHRLYRIASDPAQYAHLDDLEAALALALRERNAQRHNPLYAHDLVDLMRQYLAELSNRRFQQLYVAFTSGDKQTFGREAKAIEWLLDAVETVLATRDDYRVDSLLRKAKRLGKTERSVKDRYLTFVNTPWLRDYQSKDMFELVRFYYRPRVDAFLRALRERLQPVHELPTTTNLASNPGFEQGHGDQPAHWGTGFVHKGGAATRVKEVGCTGDFCGKLTTPTREAYANLFQDVQVHAGEAFRLSGRIKTKGDCRVQFAADFRTGDWPQSNYGSAYNIGGSFQGNQDWRSVSGYFLVPTPRTGKARASVTMRLYCRQGGGPGTSCFDDINLQRVPVDQAPIVPEEQLNAAYGRIEREWLERPLPPNQSPPSDPVQVVARVFSELKAASSAGGPSGDHEP